MNLKAQDYNKKNLTIKINNISNTNGIIRIGFYRKKDDFPNPTTIYIFREIKPEKKGSLEVSWNDIPYDNYAIAIFQDINGDKKMKTNIFGAPLEPYCFSRNLKPTISKPKFEDCEIVFDKKNYYFETTLIN